MLFAKSSRSSCWTTSRLSSIPLTTDFCLSIGLLHFSTQSLKAFSPLSKLRLSGPTLKVCLIVYQCLVIIIFSWRTAGSCSNLCFCLGYRNFTLCNLENVALKGRRVGQTESASASDNNANVRFVIPGLEALTDPLSETFNVTGSGCVQGLSYNLKKDLSLYEAKASGFRLMLANDTDTNENGEKKLSNLPDPLGFWISQVMNKLYHISNKPNICFKESSKDFFTTLPEVAQDLLAVPSTSVPSERLFSFSGLLSQGRKSCIKPVQLEKRTIVKANPVL